MPTEDSPEDPRPVGAWLIWDNPEAGEPALRTLAPAHAALAAVVRVLRHTNPALAELVNDLAGDVASLQAHLVLPLLHAEHGPVKASREAVIEHLQKLLEEFERMALRPGPKPSFEKRFLALSDVHKVEEVAFSFRKLMARKARTTRRKWEQVCRDLWQGTLGQARPLPSYVVDAVVTARALRSRALCLVAASQGPTADPETLRRRVTRSALSEVIAMWEREVREAQRAQRSQGRRRGT